MKESEVALALHERSRYRQNPTGAVCACLFFPKTPACSHPRKQRKGLEQETSVDTCHGALSEGEHLLPFVKTQYTIPYAVVRGVGSNLWAHTLHPPVTSPTCSATAVVATAVAMLSSRSRWPVESRQQNGLEEAVRPEWGLWKPGVLASLAQLCHYRDRNIMLFNFFLMSFPCLSFFFSLSNRTFKWPRLEKDYLKERINL